jgi:hypothetical protein
MEKNAANHFGLILRMPAEQKAALATIRHWGNVKLALADGYCWAKDFTASQQDDMALKILPQHALFYIKENLLYPVGSLLPIGHLPTGLLWTPIEKALPLQMPSLNHNFFGVQATVRPQLMPALRESPAAAMLVDMASLQKYINTAPAIRLQQLTWVLLPPHQALLIGTPLLPVQGDTYWACGSMLLPTGLDFEWPLIAPTLVKLIDPTGQHWILWHRNSSYSLLPKAQLRPLSISAFRLSMGLANTPQSHPF